MYSELRWVYCGPLRSSSQPVDLLRGGPRVSDDNVVAEGYWSRPGPLGTCQHDFLCVDGYLKGEGEKTSDSITFMVDTGSDVITARPETLKDLELPYKGRVQSRGAHADREMDLYQAILVIGGHEMEVEVIRLSLYQHTVRAGCPRAPFLFRCKLMHQSTQHSTTQHSTAQHSTAQHSTAQHSTTQHSTAQHSTAQHNTTQHKQHNEGAHNSLMLQPIHTVYPRN